MASLAARHGLTGPEALHDHPENAALAARRASPFILQPGDVVFIPDGAPPKRFSAPTSKTKKFCAPRRMVPFRLVVRDLKARALASKRYRLRVGGREYSGRTGGDGLIAHDVPCDAECGELTLDLSDERDDMRVHWEIRLGHLDPIDETSGVKGRLENLGYDCGGTDGGFDDRTESALRAFQTLAGLEPTGHLDDLTRDRLKGAHGGT
jgi:hypothetical protein